MALSKQIKNGFQGSITLSDGTPTTPLTLTVANANMDFAVSGVTPHNLREVNHYQCRGKYVSSALTERVFPTGSFSVMFTEFSENTTGTLYDFILGQGAYSARLSKNSNPQVFCCDITYVVEGTDVDDAADHTITLENCEIRFDSLIAEGDPNTVSVAFTVLGDITDDISASQDPA